MGKGGGGIIMSAEGTSLVGGGLGILLQKPKRHILSQDSTRY